VFLYDKYFNLPSNHLSPEGGRRLICHCHKENMEAPKSNKGGRPPKESREKKTFKVELKLNQEDFNHLEKLYQNAGYRNKSDMYYDMLFHKVLKQKDSDTLLVLKEIQDLTREIKGIGAEYSQVVKQVEGLPEARSVTSKLQELIDLTAQVQEKEKEMFEVVLKLREKWLRE
jgi:hypothetical protein